MRKWCIENENEIKLIENLVDRGQDEVKVKMSKVALSADDIVHFVTDSEHIVPGHSGVAYVSEADESLGFKLGSRVIVSPFIKAEKHGVERVDVLGVNRDGLLVDFVSLPAENVYAIPDGISDNEAVFTDYVALGSSIIESMDCDKGDYILISSASTVGLILAQIAIYYQLVPILVDINGDKLKLAESWGVYYTLNPMFDNLERRVEEITGGRMCDFAVFTGDSIPFANIARLVKENGVVIVSGYSSHQKHQLDMNVILDKKLTVKGVADGIDEMSSAINLLANKIIKIDGVITESVYFEDVPEMIKKCVEYPYQFNNILIEI
ncbi:MAG: zinc-binding dehydrogenase [Clostridia bacterium]|nr:zinc-binding dehydrogenase [Clostridia bacterium]